MISLLSLDQLTRDVAGSYDGMAIAQIAPLAFDDCYEPKFAKAPDIGSEVLPANGYLACGLKLVPGSVIVGIYLPGAVNTGVAPPFNLQITDVALGRKFWDCSIPSFFIGNFKPTCADTLRYVVGSFPNLLNGPYPVVGEGLFLVEFWETTGVATL